MRLTKNAETVLRERYLLPGETPDDLFRRVARAVARAEEDKKRWETAFYEFLTSLKFLPNSPTLFNAGTGQGCLSACFVMNPDDTMQSIMQVATDAAMVEKWGGGIGFGFSRLRPRGDQIRTTHRAALGVVATMKIYATIGEEMTQGGKRNGAHMGQLIVSHPEVRGFIHCKDGDDAIQNFNISVQVTDEFMRAVDRDEEWHLVNPRDGSVAETVKAKDLWRELCQSAWKTGDPGVVFIDRVWETAPNPHLGKIESSNPCGEEMLENYGSCNLGSIDLGKHLDLGRRDFDWKELEGSIRLGVRFLNDVIEVNEFPPEVPRLKEMNEKTKRIGLGVMGWADALTLLEIPYDSQEAVDLAEKVALFFRDTSWDESAKLADERGPYPEWERSALKDRLQRSARNSSVMTIAPTGSIALIAGCSSGIEPYFARANTRKALWTKEDAKEELLECIPLLRHELERRVGSEKAEEVLWTVAKAPSVEAGDKILESYGVNARLYRGAMDIDPKWHVLHQAAWQRGVTNSVSKTINLRESAAVEDVEAALRLAWQTGCKAVTVYRDKSKKQQVLEAGGRERGRVVERPDKLYGFTTRVRTGHGTMFVTINADPKSGRPLETFVTLGKSGGCVNALMEALGRAISTALRGGVDPEELARQMTGICCGHTAWEHGYLVLSAPDGFGKVLMEAVNGEAEAPAHPPIMAASGQLCSRCGGAMIPQEGCLVCQNCGATECGG